MRHILVNWNKKSLCHAFWKHCLLAPFCLSEVYFAFEWAPVKQSHFNSLFGCGLKWIWMIEFCVSWYGESGCWEHLCVKIKLMKWKTTFVWKLYYKNHELKWNKSYSWLEVVRSCIFSVLKSLPKPNWSLFRLSLT